MWVGGAVGNSMRAEEWGAAGGPLAGSRHPFMQRTLGGPKVGMSEASKEWKRRGWRFPAVVISD